MLCCIMFYNVIKRDSLINALDPLSSLGQWQPFSQSMSDSRQPFLLITLIAVLILGKNYPTPRKITNRGLTSQQLIVSIGEGGRRALGTAKDRYGPLVGRIN